MFAVILCTIKGLGFTQADKWKEEDKEIYESIKALADIVVYTSESYTPYCMYKRNRFLVDDSSACICYLTEKSRGTFYTVGYAKKNNLTVLNIADKIG
ncbi:MAG: SLOG family protein [Ruminiclostridium sp.]|nr:SLOG family protein [Ruminiclostridium sp.]